MKAPLAYFLVVFSLPALCQTSLSDRKKVGNVHVWNFKDAKGKVLGKAYSIDEQSLELRFYPAIKDVSKSTMVLTGTYTSANGQVAGTSLDSTCTQVGNQTDKYFKPNAYLHFVNGTAEFVDKSVCNAIPVYKVVDDSVLTTVIKGRINEPRIWRFFVQKNWIKEYEHSERITEESVDILIIDLDTPMTLLEASTHVQGLQRKSAIYGKGFVYSCSITASLLDTGPYRPFLLNGTSVHGDFSERQSNVIVVR